MTTRKTIGFTIHSLNAGGSERVVTALANELIKHYNVKIITLEQCNSFYELNSNIDLLSCNFNIAKKRNKIGAIKDHLTIVKKISTIVKKESIDLIIGFTTSINVFTILAAKLNNIPVIISERNNPIADSPNTYWRALRNISYKYANYLVVQTSPNKEFFTKIVASKKIVIIKNPVATAVTSKRILAQKNTENKIILTVGRLDANKSQDLLLKAFSNISNQNDWQVQLVGDGHKMKEYKTIAKDLKIDDRTFFEGNVSNIHDYYNNASIFVFTSKSEGYPNALAEALYFGVPSISTNCPHGPADLIEHNTNGILIEVDNQQMLETQLQKLMTDEQTRFKLSENSKTASKKLEIGLITSSWVKYLDELL